MGTLRGALGMGDAGHAGVAAVLALLGVQALRVLLYAGLVSWLAGMTKRESGSYPTFAQLVDAMVVLLRPGRPAGRRRRPR